MTGLRRRRAAAAISSADVRRASGSCRPCTGGGSRGPGTRSGRRARSGEPDVAQRRADDRGRGERRVRLRRAGRARAPTRAGADPVGRRPDCRTRGPLEGRPRCRPAAIAPLARHRGIVPSGAQLRLTTRSSSEARGRGRLQVLSVARVPPGVAGPKTPSRRCRTPSSRALSRAARQCTYGVSKYVSLATSPTESWNAPAPAVRGAAKAGPCAAMPAAAARATTAATGRTGVRRLNPFMRPTVRRCFGTGQPYRRPSTGCEG